ncbi:hypothetical protein [Ferribacterium limneticum]|uniref:hypothetical protein n=1 Tax=Ferribacterium limneticum TaxID=76259 RepID=UPI001CFB8445|nr:hypothetical protein [Ferribacterium limneticum]UCV20433.1 hypothetical protein KI610_07640 [Ferribacterium limneticum]
MPSPIIARADALMHRRRQTDSEFDDVPVLTDSVDEFDDIPVLTEVEPMPEMEAVPEPVEIDVDAVADTPLQIAPETPSSIDPGLRDELIRELTGRIEDRIKAALPEIISSTIRDFLAEQEMIENS